MCATIWGEARHRTLGIELRAAFEVIESTLRPMKGRAKSRRRASLRARPAPRGPGRCRGWGASAGRPRRPSCYQAASRGRTAQERRRSFV
ncbi:hypothetical protein FIBSPDRAFT_403234 [Athelia psychrophila]|uniref:Uncharacterized protein n=1 Tax=Athelia psychrophila TaxID=1759441 RepID=A0A166NJ34_9AGAM|nr:hypothetical protein FIBSPDRAFT_403234 [Fibularhizoctonia sp. CBS 109695]